MNIIKFIKTSLTEKGKVWKTSWSRRERLVSILSITEV